MKIPEIKAIYNVGDGLIKFYHDDEFITEWVCKDALYCNDNDAEIVEFVGKG